MHDKTELDISIDNRIKIIEALDKQIEGVLSHCPGVEVHEKVVSDNERLSIEVIFSYAIEISKKEVKE